MILPSLLATALQFSQPNTSSLSLPGSLTPLVTHQIQGGLPRRGSLGASFAPLPKDVSDRLGLKPGVGLLVKAPVSGLTADRAGLKDGDALLMINGTAVVQGGISSLVRTLQSGAEVTFKVDRGGKELSLKGTMVERPRDPGTKDYSVAYSHVDTACGRMRTIISTPKKEGKHPALFFIQGLSPLSYDYVMDGPTNDVMRMAAPILHEFAKSGFVTIRVEKPGVGDSEGGPYQNLGFTEEIDIYRQAMKQLKAMKEVDTDKVLIFGHSMGGTFGPIIAAESPVKGIAVYGTASRSWGEYLNDTLRYQGLLGGESYSQAEESVRAGSRTLGYWYNDKKSPEQIAKDHPALAPYVNALLPGGLFNGKNDRFWGELAALNSAAYWEKLNCSVLAIHGSSDFVSYEIDHRLIADIVNRSHPGKGRFVSAPAVDHLLNKWGTEKEALANYAKGDFNPVLNQILMDWAKETLEH